MRNGFTHYSNKKLAMNRHPLHPIYYAHSGNPNDYSSWQTLRSHALNVGDMAAEFAVSCALKFMAGLEESANAF